MSPVDLFADGAVATTLTSSPGIAATSFTVASSTGFPAASSAGVPPTQFRCLIGTEMVTVLNVAGSTWTVLPTIAAHTSGDAVGFELFAAHMQGLQYPQNPLRPAGSDYESYPRNSNYTTPGSPPTATLMLTAIALPSGLKVGHIGFASGGASSITNWWFGLYDASRVQLALTATQGSTSWPANTVTSLAVATIASGAASVFTTTYAGLYYVGVMQQGTTPSSLVGSLPNAALAATPPILNGTSDTGQSTPPTFPHTAIAITATSVGHYGFVGA